MTRITQFLASAAIAAVVPVAAHANLISNGTFAAPGCASSTFCEYNGGSTSITGWTVTGSSVDLITGYWQAPPGGGNSVDLDGAGQGGVASSSFSSNNGSQYELTFDLSGNPDGNLGPHTVQVDIDGTIQDFTFDTAAEANSKGDMKWVQESMIFTANTTLSSISFTSLDAADEPYGPVIGDVDIEAVPEPATLSLFGVGLFALGFVSRRKTRSRA
jgi:choice-of-anchor C domain-containing protein